MALKSFSDAKIEVAQNLLNEYLNENISIDDITIVHQKEAIAIPALFEYAFCFQFEDDDRKITLDSNLSKCGKYFHLFCPMKFGSGDEYQQPTLLLQYFLPDFFDHHEEGKLIFSKHIIKNFTIEDIIQHLDSCGLRWNQERVYFESSFDIIFEKYKEKLLKSKKYKI